MLRRALSSPHRGRIEIAALAFLYVVYELVRGLTELDFAAARENTAQIVSLEQRLHIFVERDSRVSPAPAGLGCWAPLTRS